MQRADAQWPERRLPQKSRQAVIVAWAEEMIPGDRDRVPGVPVTHREDLIREQMSKCR